MVLRKEPKLGADLSEAIRGRKGRKTGYLTSKPPLLDLALINLGHYQKYSDYSEGVRMCIPQLCFKGIDPNQSITVIGHYTFHVVRPDGDVWFAEPTGAGLSPQRQDLQDLETQMARLGLAIIALNAPRPEKHEGRLLNLQKIPP